MNIQTIIESILFISAEPVEIDVIANHISKKKEETSKIIEEIMTRKEKQNEAIEIVKIGEKYTLSTKKEETENVISLFDKRQNPKLTDKSMEVLSIIAYNDDVTRAQIEQIRGVASDGIINRLLDYGLITEGKRHETIGRPIGYKVTDKFLMTFGINSLKELPRLEDITMENIESIESNENNE